MPNNPGTDPASVLDAETNTCTAVMNLEAQLSFALAFHELPSSHAVVSSEPEAVVVDACQGIRIS